MLAISHALVALTLFGPLLFSGVLQTGERLSLEVFTAAEFPVSGSGYSVSSAGDVNGDGYDDLIIGANSADPNGKDAAPAAPCRQRGM